MSVHNLAFDLHAETQIPIERVWAMPTADTFDCPPIGAFVRKYLDGSRLSIDPFARNKRWATYTNDLNPGTAAEYHMDVLAFLAMLCQQGVCADLIIIDPPYSPRQVKECYDGVGRPVTIKDSQCGAFRWELRPFVDRLLIDGGIVLNFGWSSAGMGKDYEKLEILLVCHGAGHNDTICVAERKRTRL